MESVSKQKMQKSKKDANRHFTKEETEISTNKST